MTRVYFLATNIGREQQRTHKAISLNFRDGQQRTFNPSAIVPDQFVPGLLEKTATIGGCCGEPSRTVHLFATEAQLNAGERTWYP